MRLIILSQYQSTNLRNETKALESRLSPRRIDAGANAGKFALSEAVLTDPDHAEFVDTLSKYPVVDVDPNELWPPEEV